MSPNLNLLALLAIAGNLHPSAAAAPLSLGGPKGTPPGWLATVQTRIAADAAAIHSVGGGAFAADLPAVGLKAWFDAEGVTLGSDDGQDLVVQTRAWGREGSFNAPDAQEPAIGACTAAVDPAGQCVRRLEYASAGMTEWWLGTGSGVEQGFTVEDAPDGYGRLVFEVGLANVLDVSALAGGAEVVDASGRTWEVSQVVAWDALGHDVPAVLKVVGDGFRILVDDSDATYPITVDPVYETAAWSVEGGEGDAPYGGSVAGAGDVNGDGYDDVIIGANGYRAATGRAYVYEGSSSGLSETAAATLTGENEGDDFGFVVTGVGDVNGDGYDDVVVGADLYDAGSGRAYLYVGSATGTGTAPLTTLDAESAGEYFAVSVGGAGDVDADGYDDVIVGASGAVGDGRAYMYSGSSSGLSIAPSVTLSGPRGTNFGTAVAGAGDVDDDGHADVIVGASADSFGTGAAYVFSGGSSGVSTVALAILAGSVEYGEFGCVVAGAGDVNADGYGDVIVGNCAGSVRFGDVTLYPGSSTGPSTTGATTLRGENLDDQFGCAVAAAGDVNADGFEDVLVGAWGYDRSAGRATIYPGTAAGLSSTPLTVLDGETGTTYFGAVLAGAGDVNGDGHADVVVASPAWSASTGRADVFMGDPAGVDTTAAVGLLGVATSDGLGSAVTTAGDVNGDGYGDVAVAAFAWHGSTGRVYVYAGSPSGLSASTIATLTGASESDYFGYALAGGGDVNGDGYDDVVVGAWGVANFSGQVYVYPGSVGGTSELPMATLDSFAPGDLFGESVALVPDTNGDGYSEVFVGAPGAISGGGRAYVYSGSSTGLSLGSTLQGSGASFGAPVAAAGDLNSDGFGDVVVGEYAWSAGTGKAWVFMGSATGVSTTAATELEGQTEGSRFGRSVAGAGDLNGDGYDDLIVGAPAQSPASAYVFEGSAAGLSTTPRVTLTGAADFGFGVSASAAGDVNGDGYGDVIVGEYWDTTTGSAYVYVGSPDGLRSGRTAVTDATSSSYFGWTVSGAGDVNGDGYDEVIVGAYGYDHASGRAYLYEGYPVDADGDGAMEGLDCDDADPTLGEAAVIGYPDADGDTYGDPSAPVSACVAPSGLVSDATDCDDSNAAVNVAEAELCDGIDNNCDDVIDGETAEGGTLWFADVDRDSYGDPTSSVQACTQPEGHVADNTDCDDSLAAVNPGRDEIAGDGVDQDCDGVDLEDDAGTPDKSGCGCATQRAGGGSGIAALLLLAPLVALTRRRRRWFGVRTRRFIGGGTALIVDEL